jgi:hypothetical protein
MKSICKLCCIATLLLIPTVVAFCQSPPVPNDGTLPPAPPNVESDAPPAASTPDKSKSAGKAKSPATDQLSVEQARLADRFKRLEEVIGRLAELSAPTDPRRAKLLREAIAQSREQDVNTRFESIVKLLQDERLSAAATNQTELQKELDGLLGLLLKADRDKELSNQRERIKNYIKQVDRIIRMQKGVRARTEGGDELKGLGSDQQKIAADTGKLGGDISKTDGDKTPESDKPPKSGDKDQPKADEKEKPKSDDKQKPKTDDKDKPKSNDKQKPGNDAPKPGEPSKPDDSQKPGDKSKSGKPSDGGKPQPSKSKPAEGQPSEGKPSKPSNSPPSDSPPSQGKPGSPSDDENSDQQPKPPQPQEPADRAAKKLREAQQRMEEATKKIEESIRKGATEQQLQAIKDLELAKAELERVLRQLREEELERTLTQLAARFRKMLDLQTAVYDGTVKLDRVPEAQRTHDHEIEAARLSRQESQIVDEVNKALLLLHEDGSSVAFPEAIEQMRDDMRQVTDRLAAIKVEKVTQGIEKDIIAALEETIAAFEQSRKDLEKKKTPPGQQPAAGQPDEMSLVEKIAELKMIRSLQMRINNRTKTYGEMIQGDQAETPDLLKALDGLAERQQRVYKAAADLYQQGVNKNN